MVLNCYSWIEPFPTEFPSKLKPKTETLQGNNKNSKQTHTKGFQSKKYLSELRLKKLPEVHVNTSE